MIAPFTPKAVNAYFEQLAVTYFQHSSDNIHFAQSYMELIEKAPKTLDLQNLCLILDTKKGYFTDNLSGQKYDAKKLTFFILETCEPDNFEREQDIYHRAYLKLRELYQHFINEKTNCKSLMFLFDPNSIEYEEVGPEVENSFGLMVSLKTNVPCN